MFGRGFAATVLAPAAQGQPAIVARPVLWFAGIVFSHPALWNAVFAGIQLALGIALLVPSTARKALFASIAWALGVWWFGEGAGMVLGGAASPRTGAPGAAVLYAVIAIVALSRSDRAPQIASAVVWCATALLWLPIQPSLALVWAAVGVGALTRRPGPFIAAGVAISAVVWVIGQSPASLLSGMATDPNIAPLFVLLALAVDPHPASGVIVAV
jgi:hypothetical protein